MRPPCQNPLHLNTGLACLQINGPIYLLRRVQHHRQKQPRCYSVHTASMQGLADTCLGAEVVVGDVCDQEVGAQAQAGPPHILRRAMSPLQSGTANPMGTLLPHPAPYHSAWQLVTCCLMHLKRISLPDQNAGRACREHMDSGDGRCCCGAFTKAADSRLCRAHAMQAEGPGQHRD